MGLSKETESQNATPSHLDKLKVAMDEQFIKSSKIVNSFRGSNKLPADSISGESPSAPGNSQALHPLPFSSLSSSTDGISSNLNFPRLPTQQRPSLDKPEFFFETPVASNRTNNLASRRSFEQSNSSANSLKDLGGVASINNRDNLTTNDSRGDSTNSSLHEPFETDYFSEWSRPPSSDPLESQYPNFFEFAFLLVSTIDISLLWKNVIDIFTQQYLALELSLIEPCDVSDPFNTPWKLKCLYQGSKARNQKNDTNDSEMDNKKTNQSDSCSITASTGAKGIIYNSQRSPPMRSPLIDHYTVQTVLERKAALVYTRRHTYPSGPSPNSSGISSTERITQSEGVNGDSSTKKRDNSISDKFPLSRPSKNKSLGGPDSYDYCSDWVTSREADRGMYDEFEQSLLSPWSKSPLGSPAIQTDSNRNPFFQGLQEASFLESNEKKDESFNDAQNLHNETVNDYFSHQSQAEHDTALSLVHIPLIHPGTGNSNAPSNRVPVAILSFKSNLVPYPDNLISYIDRLVPFIFAGYTNCLATMIPSNVPSLQSHDNLQPNLHSRSAAGTKHGDRCYNSEDANACHHYGENTSSNLSEDKLINFYFMYSKSIKTSPKLTVNGLSLRFHSTLQRLKRVMNKKRRGFNHKCHTAKKECLKSKESDENSLKPTGGDLGQQIQLGGASPQFSLLKSIIDSIPVHVFIADPLDGTVVWANGRTLLYCGLSLDGLLKKQFSCIHPNDLQSFMRGWKQFLSSAEVFTKEIRLQRFDGMYRFFICRAVPLLDCSGSVLHVFGTMTDVHEQKIAELEVQRQSTAAANENNYRSLAEASPQIVFAASTKNGIIYANAQWLSYSGLSFENSLGLCYLSAVHRDDREKCLLPNPGHDPGNESSIDNTYVAEIRFRSTDGCYRWHLVKSVCVNNSADYDSNLWLGTCTDIHDHKVLEEKLKEANVEAHRIVRDKMQYLSNMSHEIRTPLIGITGMVSFLLETELSSEQTSYAHVIQQSAESLLTVINDILDLSKVRAGMVKLSSERFSLRALMEDANETLSTLAFYKGIELNFIVDHNIPDVLSGDRNRIRQVALNVISNAIKFTDTGEVITLCSVGKWLNEDQSVILKWECIDTGPGFDLVDQSRIFKPFSQIDASNARKQGSGLGLVISRELAELHGGEMKCKSIKSVGTHFIWTAKFKVDNEYLNYDMPDGCCPVCFHPYEISEKKGIPNVRKYGGEIAKTPTENVEEVCPHSKDVNKDDENGRSKEQKNGTINSGYNNPYAPSLNYCRCSTSLDPSNILFWKLYRFHSEGLLLNYNALVVVVSHTRFSAAALVNFVQTLLHEKTLKDIISFKDPTRAYHYLVETPIKSNVSHIVLNLAENEDYITYLRSLQQSASYENTNFIVIVSAKQKAALSSLFSKHAIDQSRLHFVLRLLKPSKLFPIFYKDCPQIDKNLRRSSLISERLADEQKAEAEDLRNDLKKFNFRVLLAEDNIINIKVISRFLDKMGVEYNVAMDGLKCFEEWKRKDPHYYSLVLMDLQMPVMDGYQACTEIRKRELQDGLEATSIVALSANALSHVAASCEECGFDTYLSKPITLKHLTAVVSKMFYKKTLVNTTGKVTRC
ncbi:phosphorelay sensor kinase Mak1 [Schizosaccharomyces osmophilus]|uniref:Phosphorelay sensor kinase Mak1 n=1 Tax=Schizosaccharomyces osmophilus TaxID=2545709 RepID=A0AAF0AVW7_9SCHI|nr:phosphorelay sensor kinase Mak1 [Schizosaccharomyces osmophilus]WBW74026.1 phosphorelay sensor kinase Mak1 [Schizosaccharomyces osmophilus]